MVKEEAIQQRSKGRGEGRGGRGGGRGGRGGPGRGMLTEKQDESYKKLGSQNKDPIIRMLLELTCILCQLASKQI